MRVLVIAGRAEGADAPTELLMPPVVRALRGAGHEVATLAGEAAEAEMGRAADVVITIGEAAQEIGAERKIAWLVGVLAPPSGQWHRVVPAHEAHARSLARMFGRGVGPIVRPVVEPSARPERRNLDRFLYCAPPWVGLHRLLAFWPALWGRWGLPLSVTGDVRSWCRANAANSGELGERARAVAARIDQPGVVLHRRLTEDAMISLSARARAALVPHEPLADGDGGLALPWLSWLAEAGCPAVGSAGELVSGWHPAVVPVGGWDPDGWAAGAEEAELRGAHPAVVPSLRGAGEQEWAGIVADVMREDSPAVLQPAADARPHIDDFTWKPPPLLP